MSGDVGTAAEGRAAAAATATAVAAMFHFPMLDKGQGIDFRAIGSLSRKRNLWSTTIRARHLVNTRRHRLSTCSRKHLKHHSAGRPSRPGSGGESADAIERTSNDAARSTNRGPPVGWFLLTPEQARSMMYATLDFTVSDASVCRSGEWAGGPGRRGGRAGRARQGWTRTCRQDRAPSTAAPSRANSLFVG